MEEDILKLDKIAHELDAENKTLQTKLDKTQDKLKKIVEQNTSLTQQLQDSSAKYFVETPGENYSEYRKTDKGKTKEIEEKLEELQSLQVTFNEFEKRKITIDSFEELARENENFSFQSANFQNDIKALKG